jgi:hypothetical protein
MRIHTRLTREQFEGIMPSLIADGLAAEGTRIEFTEHKSRTHDRAFDTKMISTSAPTSYEKRRRENAYGHGYGSRDEFGGTWQEHGFFFARLFSLDDDANVYGIYNGEFEFSNKTLGIFDDLTPLTRGTADDLKPGDYITGWGRSGSGLGIVRKVEDLDKRRAAVYIDLYGGLYGFRFTDRIIMRKDRPVLIAR